MAYFAKIVWIVIQYLFAMSIIINNRRRDEVIEELKQYSWKFFSTGNHIKLKT
jgi:hypothetical protein